MTPTKGKGQQVSDQARGRKHNFETQLWRLKKKDCCRLQRPSFLFFRERKGGRRRRTEGREGRRKKKSQLSVVVPKPQAWGYIYHG